MVTAGAPYIPIKLLDQLSMGGRIVIPVGSQESQRLFVITRAQTGYDKKVYEYFKFVPLIGEEGWSAS
jgi:protein-L-isoaspartate(D-aspartate) O-methyltransferase